MKNIDWNGTLQMTIATIVIDVTPFNWNFYVENCNLKLCAETTTENYLKNKEKEVKV